MNNTHRALADMLLRPEAVYVTEHKRVPMYCRLKYDRDTLVMQMSFDPKFSPFWEETDINEMVSNDPVISYRKYK